MNSFISFTMAVAILSVSITLVSGLQCYSCESRESEACGRNPNEANRISCDINDFCIVKRAERSDSNGRKVTILRGCRQSASVSAVSAGGNGVNISVSTQLCSTDLCNTGNGLGSNGKLLFPGFNISTGNNGFGFANNDFGVWNDFKKIFNQAYSQSGSVATVGKKMVLSDVNGQIPLKMLHNHYQPKPSNEANMKKGSIGGSKDTSRSLSYPS